MRSSFRKNVHYRAIVAHYGAQRAERSGVLYIQHIDEGLKVLDLIGASQLSKEAYCIHPIVQDDKAIAAAFEAGSALMRFRISPLALVLAIEYRWIANSYLSQRRVTDPIQVKLSPRPEVQEMLVADKVQNRNDFELFHKGKHPRSKHLIHYFKMWMRVLGVTESKYRQLKRAIQS